ncbi:MAG TPA: hypothetical protein VE991_06960 [Acidimicrobiales bacterium]|nr:hypothetical protein [Acidimicrobiales bacterium]
MASPTPLLALPLRPTVPVGTRVAVRDRFLGDWTGGFAVAGHHEEGYRIRRLSDGSVFPVLFAPEDVRV